MIDALEGPQSPTTLQPPRLSRNKITPISSHFNRERDMEEEDPRSVPDEHPLIPRSPMGIEFSRQQSKERGFNSSNIVEELKKQGLLGGPLVLVSFLQYSLRLITVMFIGHLGELSLSSSSMAISFAEVTGFSIMLGMASALDTFCGQAYGAENYRMLSIYVQRAMLILMLMGIPIAFIWMFTDSIFVFFGQDLEISAQAGIFARWLIPSIFPYGILQCQLGFLQTQNNVNPLMISTILTSIFHVLLCWILVFTVGLGHKGAALSIGISYWINVLILAIYIKFSPACRETWTGFSVDGSKDLIKFLSVAIPSTLMVSLECWLFDILVLISGLLPNQKLETSVMAVSVDTSALVFRIPLGLSFAVSTRVANELGAGKPGAAQLAVKVVILLAIAEGVLVSLISVAVRNIWGYAYSNEEEVVKYMASIIPVLAISYFMDGIQAVLSGIARGCGWQNIGALVNLGAYYLVGLPSSIILAFVFHLRVKGLWIGIAIGSGLQALLFLAIVLRTNWEHQAEQARERVNASSTPTDMTK